jgi:starvation-inducible DNA-binding protein
LNNLYNEIWLAVDAIAEHIRTLDAYAPGSLSRYSQLSVIDDQLNIPSAKAMLAELELDNQKIINELNKALELAESANKHGLANFIQDRIDIHEKHKWMLRASGK